MTFAPPIPHERLLLSIGLLAGAALFAVDANIAFGVFTFFGIAGIIWRSDEPPILPFCFCYQWIYANTGYWGYLWTGTYPDTLSVGEIEAAVLLSNLGLWCVALGVRFVYQLRQAPVATSTGILESIDTFKLLKLVVAVYSVSWFIILNPALIWFSGAQIIANLLLCRDGLLVVLLLACLRQSRFRTASVVFLFAAVPTLLSPQAKIAHYLFIAIVLLVGEAAPRVNRSIAEARRHLTARVVACQVIAITIVVAVFWVGGIKNTWRAMANEGGLENSVNGRLGQMASLSTQAAKVFDMSLAVDAISRRTSSDLLYFSYVLDRVPKVVPHEGGSLISSALEHISKPRILFPNKRNLGGTSWMVRKYAGVAASDRNTSIGFGYICELYIDLGIPWMFVPLFLWGALIAVASYLLRRYSPYPELGTALFIAVTLQHNVGYGSDVTKLLGGYVQSVGIALLVLSLFYARIVHYVRTELLGHSGGSI